MMKYVEENLERVSALTLITPIKQGFVPGMPGVRYAEKLRGVLSAIYGAVKAREAPTALDTISTVHFARWVIFDHDQQLLFTSNYDGSLEGYLRDFVNNDDVAKLLDLVWENCEEYPGASSREYQRFESWVSRYSIPTTCFYAATPELTVMDIKWLRGLKELYDQLIQRVQKNPADLSEAFHDFQGNVRELDTHVWSSTSSMDVKRLRDLKELYEQLIQRAQENKNDLSQAIRDFQTKVRELDTHVRSSTLPVSDPPRVPEATQVHDTDPSRASTRQTR